MDNNNLPAYRSVELTSSVNDPVNRRLSASGFVGLDPGVVQTLFQNFTKPLIIINQI